MGEENLMKAKEDFKNISSIIMLLMRLAVGMIFWTAGLQHLGTGIGEFVRNLLVQFAGTILPPFLIASFGYILPFLETIVGLLLLIGLFTRLAFIAAAILFLNLVWGPFLIAQTDVASQNAVFFLISILGLRWSEAQLNHYSLDYWLSRKSPPPSSPSNS